MIDNLITVGSIFGGAIVVTGFLMKKWIAGVEKKLCQIEERKVDAKLCLAFQSQMTQQTDHLAEKIDDVKEDIDEIKADVKQLIGSVSSIAKRGE